MTNKDFSLFPSPCYIMEEGLLRKNLALIKVWPTAQVWR